MTEIVIDQLVRCRRRSIGLQITRDARLVVRAPQRVSLAQIQELVQAKREWILRKQALWRTRQQEVAHVIPPAPRELRQLRQRARQLITERVAIYAAQTGLQPRAIRINSAQTRWGSCSPNGNVNFTWRLSLAPLHVIDYVVVHELVHLQEKNHSAQFWQKVAAIMPEYRAAHKWLHQNGHRLVATCFEGESP